MAAFGYLSPEAAAGQKRKFVLTRQLTFKGQLCSESCQMGNGSTSAGAAIHDHQIAAVRLCLLP